MGLGFLKWLNPIGAGLGAIASTKAHNRGEKLGSQMDLEQLLMQREGNYQDMRIGREQEGRAGGLDAFKRLMMAQHVTNPGAKPQLSPYSVAPRQASDGELMGADAMAQEVMQRLRGGNPIPQVNERPLEVDRKLMDPGMLEKIFGYAAPFLGAVGTAAQKQRV